jgi:hypothetical protein
MALQSDSSNPEELCVLNDVRFFNLTTRRWLPSSTNSPQEPIPKARYAHLSSVTSNRLFVIGGQDLSNVWLDDIYVFDLRTQSWTQRRDYPVTAVHIGASPSAQASPFDFPRRDQSRLTHFPTRPVWHEVLAKPKYDQGVHCPRRIDSSPLLRCSH